MDQLTQEDLERVRGIPKRPSILLTDAEHESLRRLLESVTKQLKGQSMSEPLEEASDRDCISWQDEPQSRVAGTQAAGLILALPL